MRKFLTRLKLYVFLTSSLVISCTADSCHHLKVLSPLCKLERLSWVCIRYLEFTFWLQGNLMVSWKSFSGQHCYSSNPSKHQAQLKQSETNKYRQINPKSSLFASNWASKCFLRWSNGSSTFEVMRKPEVRWHRHSGRWLTATLPRTGRDETVSHAFTQSLVSPVFTQTVQNLAMQVQIFMSKM